MNIKSLQYIVFLACVYSSLSFSLIKRQSDLFTSNDFDASLVTNSGSGTSGGDAMTPNGDGVSAFNSMNNGNGREIGGSYGGRNLNSIGGGINPFNSNRDGNSMGSVGGGNGNGNSRGPFAGGANGNSMGPFSGGASGSNGNSRGPFSGGSNSNSAGPFSRGANSNSAGPFSGGANSNSAGPFSGGASSNSMGPFAAASKGEGMQSPFDSSNMKGGPGGMTGGMFSTDMGTNYGPGGLNGSPFTSKNVDDGGPGGLSGGSFLEKSNNQYGVDSKFDTSQYEEMLKQMFTTDSNKEGEGNPFDPNSYDKDINVAGTGRTSLSSVGTKHYHEYHSGNSGSSYGSYSQGRETSDPFSTKHFKDSKSPFKVHQTYQVGSGSRNYGTNYNNGLKSSSFLHNDNTDTYQTPFNKDTDYDELISTPFQSSSSNSRISGQGYNDQSIGTAYSPFKADRGMPGLARMNNPGGNPFNQAGSQIGRG